MPRVIWSVPRGISVVTPGFAASNSHLAERPDRFNFPQPALLAASADLRYHHTHQQLSNSLPSDRLGIASA